MSNKRKLIFLSCCVLISFCASAQNVEKSDSSTKVPRGKPKPYKEVITDKAISDTGLFLVHKVDERWYFEISDTLLHRDILIVNRISKGPAGPKDSRVFLGFAGDQIGENAVIFTKGPNNRVFLKSVSYLHRSGDTSANGMYQSVLNSNIQPIVASFDIKAYNQDSSAVVIDMTDYISGDNSILFFDTESKRPLGLGALQADKSYIEKIQSFALNIEIRTVKTYAAGVANKTFELNSSIVLLPKIPMSPRYQDNRVGYFSTRYTDYDANKVENTAMVTRWRLEPKTQDIQRYLAGELVEPQKPIVFYIDPATPKKWIPYLIQGVNDWQNAFQRAGFKNAIYALEAPINNPEWNLEDARHNAIVYKPSVISNASGPHVHDPRSGEILETHVNWYHNVLKLLQEWYFVQAAAIDPRARKMELDDSLMGQLIRFVSSHEIGHTLGLAHNFGSSSTVPVDSLRNKKWVEENGHTPSIMDYARFNYVAQPEDRIGEKGIFPRIGVYDEWAIEWGYRWFPPFKSAEEEKTYFNKWVIKELNKDNRLWYGSASNSRFDYRTQSEDLGDNSMIASGYGIQNLKKIMPHLIEWTSIPNEDYADLRRMYVSIINQYQRYLIHVINNIAGYTITVKSREQEGGVYAYTPRKKQKEAVQFIKEQFFTMPEWLFNNKFYSLIGIGGESTSIIEFSSLQRILLSQILSQTNLATLLRAQIENPKDCYPITQLLADLDGGILHQLNSQKPISIYERSLQKAYIDVISNLKGVKLSTMEEFIYSNSNQNTDVYSIMKDHLFQLIKRIDLALPKYTNKETVAHLKDLRFRLKEALEPNKSNAEKPKNPDPESINDLFLFKQFNCWGLIKYELKYLNF